MVADRKIVVHLDKDHPICGPICVSPLTGSHSEVDRLVVIGEETAWKDYHLAVVHLMEEDGVETILLFGGNAVAQDHQIETDEISSVRLSEEYVILIDHPTAELAVSIDLLVPGVEVA